jgi:hypothetical protein
MPFEDTRAPYEASIASGPEDQPAANLDEELDTAAQELLDETTNDVKKLELNANLPGPPANNGVQPKGPSSSMYDSNSAVLNRR